MNRFETVDMDMDDTEFKIIREQSKKRRRGHKKAQYTISKREKAALKKWEMEIIKEYEKANEKIKRKKSCKKQPLIKTLYAIKKPKTSRRKRRSSKAKTEEQPESESSSQTNAVPAITTTAAVVAPAAVEAVTAETQEEPTVTTPASEPEPVIESKLAEEPAAENKTMLSSMAESFGFSPSSEEKGTTESPEPKTGGKGKRKSSKAKKGGKSKTK
jgi:hypothetical protein